MEDRQYSTSLHSQWVWIFYWGGLQLYYHSNECIVSTLNIASSRLQLAPTERILHPADPLKGGPSSDCRRGRGSTHRLRGTGTCRPTARGQWTFWVAQPHDDYHCPYSCAGLWALSPGGQGAAASLNIQNLADFGLRRLNTALPALERDTADKQRLHFPPRPSEQAGGISRSSFRPQATAAPRRSSQINRRLTRHHTRIIPLAGLWVVPGNILRQCRLRLARHMAATFGFAPEARRCNPDTTPGACCSRAIRLGHIRLDPYYPFLRDHGFVVCFRHDWLRQLDFT